MRVPLPSIADATACDNAARQASRFTLFPSR